MSPDVTCDLNQYDFTLVGSDGVAADQDIWDTPTDQLTDSIHGEAKISGELTFVEKGGEGGALVRFDDYVYQAWFETH